jgi:uncharacterized protein (TIGR03000 family)
MATANLLPRTDTLALGPSHLSRTKDETACPLQDNQLASLPRGHIMNRRFCILVRIALTLIGLALTGNPLWAQAGTSYPYWGSAPSGYRPADSFALPPGLSPGYNSQLLGLASPSYAPSYSPYLGMGSSSLDLRARADLLARLPGGPHLPSSDNKAYIWLSVPADAQVWFDDDKTKQTGEFRHFYTVPLTPGKPHVYVLRIRWMKDGKPVERTRRITVHARDRIHLDFLEQDSEKDSSAIRKEEASSATVK